MPYGSQNAFKLTLSRKKAREEKRKKSPFNTNSADYKYSESNLKNKFPKLSKPELEQLKIKIRKKAKFNSAIDNLIYVIIFLILLGFVFFILKII
jgi:hypothetical protein|tara:strand:+ start:169 stop:453 length:285 start_codon:yes stop_codon:yes gene_type:complete